VFFSAREGLWRYQIAGFAPDASAWSGGGPTPPTTTCMPGMPPPRDAGPPPPDDAGPPPHDTGVSRDSGMPRDTGCRGPFGVGSGPCPDAGTDAGIDAGMPDAEAFDSGSDDDDGSVPCCDDGATGGPQDEPGSGPVSSGCSCSLASPSPARYGWLVMALWVGVVARRRWRK
jgi:hypothetical protein